MFGTESEMRKRPPLRPLGFADELHPRLDRRAVAFARVAADARADDVFPRHLPAAVAGKYVVKIQVAPIE